MADGQTGTFSSRALVQFMSLPYDNNNNIIEAVASATVSAPAGIWCSYLLKEIASASSSSNRFTRW